MFVWNHFPPNTHTHTHTAAAAATTTTTTTTTNKQTGFGVTVVSLDRELSVKRKLETRMASSYYAPF